MIELTVNNVFDKSISESVCVCQHHKEHHRYRLRAECDISIKCIIVPDSVNELSEKSKMIVYRFGKWRKYGFKLIFKSNFIF